MLERRHPMSDTIVKATAAGGQIIAIAANTKTLCEHAHEIHHTSEVTTVALGRLLTAGSLMGSMMKNDDEVLTLLIHGDGPMKGLTVTVTHRTNLKGFAYEPDVASANPMKTGPSIGEGDLRIIKDIGLKDPYVGNSPLVSGEIAEDLTYYYAVSEQTPTSVALGVTLNPDGSVLNAGGFIFQLMPFTDDDIIDKLEQTLTHSPSITDLLAENPDPEHALRTLLKDFDVTVNETLPTQFKCDCSRERVTKALLSVGKKELAEMIEDHKTIEMNCDFCGKHYYFEPAELELLLKTAVAKAKINA